MGVVSTFTFTSDTETVTRTKLNNLVANLKTEFNGSIDNSNIKAAAGIIGSKLDLSTPGAIGGTTPSTGAFTTLSSTGQASPNTLEIGGSGAVVTTIENNDSLGTSDTRLATQGNVKAYADSLVPSGVINLWSGAISAIPAGFVICDGNNSTPNLTDRFVIHADADSAGTNDVGDTGGSRTISTGNLPAHTHGSSGDHTHLVDGVTSGSGVEGLQRIADGQNSDVSTSSAGAHTHTSVGTGDDYLPKFHALAYIMKT